MYLYDCVSAILTFVVFHEMPFLLEKMSEQILFQTISKPVLHYHSIFLKMWYSTYNRILILKIWHKCKLSFHFAFKWKFINFHRRWVQKMLYLWISTYSLLYLRINYLSNGQSTRKMEGISQKGNIIID